MGALKSNITIVGNYPDIDHVPTGCYSLDRALASKNNIGMPTRTIYEISGREHVGKSTLAYFLASAITPELITLCDIEGFDKEYVVSCLESAGYKGILQIVSPVDEKKKTFRYHEDMLKETTGLMRDTKGVTAAIVDSVGAIMPIMEADGDYGEAFMGRRAKLMAQVTRKFTSILMDKEDPSIAVFVNHQQAILGGQGNTTPGGVTLKYMAACRISVWNKEIIKDVDKNFLGYQIEGTVDKLRYGGRGRKFSVVNLSGRGINKDLTAMFDCFILGLADRKTTVKINGKSVGYISKLFEDAQNDKHEKFEPFYEALADFNGVPIPIEEDMDGDPEELQDQDE